LHLFGHQLLFGFTIFHTKVVPFEMFKIVGYKKANEKAAGNFCIGKFLKKFNKYLKNNQNSITTLMTELIKCENFKYGKITSSGKINTRGFPSSLGVWSQRLKTSTSFGSKK
jgi:hypothetical protein